MEYKELTPNIGVKSVNETVQFYSEVLGFQKIVSVPETGQFVFAIVKAGNVTLMFQEMQNLQEEYPDLKAGSEKPVVTLYVKLKNMNELYQNIKTTDYLVKELHKTFYGTNEFAIRDNNGLILTITEDEEPTGQIKNYDNFFFPVDDYDTAKKFYAETLGLKVKFEFVTQGMIAFSVGNEEPAIILKDKKKFPDAKPTVWIEVDDVRKIYQENKSLNYLTEPFQIRTGWAVEFTDPSDNQLGFTDYIK